MTPLPPVCPLKTSPCVRSKRPRVCRHHARMKHVCAWCWYTRGVLNVHTGFSTFFQRAATHTNTHIQKTHTHTHQTHTHTHTPNTHHDHNDTHTPHRNTQHHAETEKEDRKKTEKERQKKTRQDKKAREDERGETRQDKRR